MRWVLGKHVCPGRNLVVAALCHILLKYDFQLRDDVRPRPSLFGIVFASDASAEITVRRRKDGYPGLTGHRHGSLQQLDWIIKTTSMQILSESRS